MSSQHFLTGVVLVAIVALVGLWRLEAVLARGRDRGSGRGAPPPLPGASASTSPAADATDSSAAAGAALLRECERLALLGVSAPMGGDGMHSLVLPEGTTACASTEYGGFWRGAQSTEGFLLAADEDGVRFVAAVCQGNEKHTHSMIAGALAQAELHAHLCGSKRTHDLQADLRAAMHEADARIRKAHGLHVVGRAFESVLGNAADLSGMGTSVTAVAIEGSLLAVAHVGEGVAFLVRDGQLERLTVSHAGLDAEEGRAALQQCPEAAETLQWVVWKVLGVGGDDSSSFDCAVRQLQANDVLVLATSLVAKNAPSTLTGSHAEAASELCAQLRAAAPLVEHPANAATAVVIRLGPVGRSP